MDYAAERATGHESEAAEKARGMWQVLRKYATPRTTITAIIWRFEAYSATPLAIFCIETFGRWNGALVVGCVMALYSALFLLLLEGERVVDALREYMRGRSLVKRFVLPVKRSEGLAGAAGRGLAAPASIMVFGPFMRAVTYRVLGLKEWAAYSLSVGGAIPHSLFWTGLVFGGVWELVMRPALWWLGAQIGALAGAFV